jgi:hypothetical protein
MEAYMDNAAMLVGVAVDLSASMRQSLRNDTGDMVSRFDSLGRAFGAFASRVESLVDLGAVSARSISADVFVYGFGLRNLPGDVCDLLSLLEIGRNVQQPPATPEAHSDPLEELRAIAAQHGRKGWGSWISENIDTAQAANLAANLRANPMLASEIGRLLPDFSAAEIRHALTIKDAVENLSGKGFWARFQETRELARSVRKGEVSGKRVTTEVIRAGGRAGIEQQVTAAQDLVRRLASQPFTPDEVFEEFQNEIGGRIWARLEEVGDTTVPARTIASMFVRASDDEPLVDGLIYGGTPMCSAMQQVEKRFQRERAKTPGRTAIFIIVSDGLPTDGDPQPIVERIRRSGVTVISCFVTDKDVQTPRVLPSKQERRWTQGARLMYRLASPVVPESVYTQRLEKWGWTVPEGARSFAQINHSTLLSEFLRAAMG